MLGLELHQRVLGVVDEDNSLALVSSELSFEGHDNDVLGGHSESLGDLLLKLGFLRGGRSFVQSDDFELGSVE